MITEHTVFIFQYNHTDFLSWLDQVPAKLVKLEEASFGSVRIRLQWPSPADYLRHTDDLEVLLGIDR